jgi:hypothetical protein
VENVRVKFESFISEASTEDQIWEFKKNTTQWFHEMNGVRAWRATHKAAKGLEIRKARIDRKPKDTPQEVHDFFDNVFKKKFGWKARSEGVFASSTPSGLIEYGKPHLMYPINGYSYLWSYMVKDLTAFLDDHDVIMSDSRDRWHLDKVWDDKKEVEKLTAQIMSSYKTKGLQEASYTSTEIMFNCPKGYYLVEDSFFKENYMELLGDNR